MHVLPEVTVMLSSLCILGLYFLSIAHAAWIIDGRGTRRVNVSQILASVSNTILADPPPACARGDMVYMLGNTWRERCRRCRCTEAGTRCTTDRDTADAQLQCKIPYTPSQQYFCAKWEDDGCCCAAEGCLLGDGMSVPTGGAMPRVSGRACETCTCRGGNQTSCVVQTCPMRCVDPVRVEGQCCPACPKGRTCWLPRWLQSPFQWQQTRDPLVVHTRPTVIDMGTSTITCTCKEGHYVAQCITTPAVAPLRQFFRFRSRSRGSRVV